MTVTEPQETADDAAEDIADGLRELQAKPAADERTKAILKQARRLILLGEGDDVAGTLGSAEFTHRARMEYFRMAMAGALVLVLFLVIAIGIYKGQNGQEISQFAAPVSGLTGIAIGWLFTSRAPTSNS